VVARAARRVRNLLIKRGILDEGGYPTEDEPREERQVELALAQASAELRVLGGERAGCPVLRRKEKGTERSRTKRRKEMQANVLGYDLEAHLRIGAGERRKLEHVSRYLLRPALATDRLRLRPDGVYEYSLRRRWSDGTVALILEPMELMEKLVALVPRPRLHLIRYFGVFAPNHGWRKEVVPAIPDGEQDDGAPGWRPAGGLVPGSGHVDWAKLLKRVWAVDVLTCVRCGSRRVLIKVVEPGAGRAILLHLGEDPAGPGAEPARGPPDWDVA